MAKARKTARKTAGGSRKAATRKTSSSKKTAGKKKTAKKRGRPAPKAYEMNFGPLKKQLRSHVEMLAASGSSDPRVQNALNSLRRFQSELTENCTPTMTIPLE